MAKKLGARDGLIESILYYNYKASPSEQHDFIVWLKRKIELDKKHNFYYMKRKAKYPEYKAGQIIYLDIGFNIGAEYRGPHYAIVLKDSPKKLGVMNVVYLTSSENKLTNDSNHHKMNTAIGDIKEAAYRIALSNPDITAERKKLIELDLKRLEKEKEKISGVKITEIATVSKLRVLEYKVPYKIFVSKEELKIIIDKIKEQYFIDL